MNMIMNMGKECLCNKCGYSWISRTEDPKECPECKSRDWDNIKEVTDENSN